MVVQYNEDSTIFGGLLGATSYNINMSFVTPSDANLGNLTQHPGFSNQPLWFCSTPSGITPQSVGFFTITS